MKTLSNTCLFLTFCCLSFTFMGCTSQQPINTPTVDPGNPILPTTTSALVPAYATSTSVPYRTPTPSFTPLPRLSPSEAVQLVNELDRTNGGCELPCWWGITPGESSWGETKHFLQSFAVEITENYPKIHKHLFRYPSPDGSGNSWHAFFYVDEKGIIDWISIHSEKVGGIFDTLQVFGAPSEIWIRSTGYYRDVEAYHYLNFLYLDIGVLVDFSGRGNLTHHDGSDYLQFCTRDFGQYSLLFLWSPNTRRSFSDFLDFLPHTSARYGRIGEVSDLDEQTFYDRFSTNPDACFETRNDIWPDLPTYTPTRTVTETPTATPWP